MATKAWQDENMDWVYNQLEDEESKEIYDNRRKYLESGDYSYIENIVRKYCKELEIWSEEIEKEKCIKLKGKKIVIWGSGERFINLLNKNNIKVSYIIDNDSSRWNHFYEDIHIVSPEYFKNLVDNKEYYLIICVAGFAQKIYNQIVENNILPQDNIIPYFGWDFLNNQYFDEQILTFVEGEVFVDVGCYNFYTSNEFIKKLHKKGLDFKKIYAFEPDNTQYDICKQRINDSGYKEKIQLFKAGLWSCSKDLYFQETCSSCSYVTDKGTNKIKAINFDSIANEQITFVKMDIEGSELEALKGMNHTICTDKPKLAICIYHKYEDMWEIPMYLKKLVPEYRLFVRHYSNIDCETVLYAVI